jgi:hypothetical protein
MLAKFSVGGIVQICQNLGNNISLGERLVHNAMASKWDLAKTPHPPTWPLCQHLRGPQDHRAFTFSCVNSQRLAES